MKKYIFLLVVVLSFLGCEKEMMDYEGKDGVYFSVQEVPPSLYGNPEIWSVTWWDFQTRFSCRRRGR